MQLHFEPQIVLLFTALHTKSNNLSSLQSPLNHLPNENIQNEIFSARETCLRIFTMSIIYWTMDILEIHSEMLLPLYARDLIG